MVSMDRPVVEITGRRGYLESCKVDDTVDGRVLLKNRVEGRFVSHVDLVEGRALPRQELHAVEGHGRRVVQAVHDDDIVVILKEREGCEGADVAGSSRGFLVLTILQGLEGSVPGYQDCADGHGCGVRRIGAEVVVQGLR